MEKKMVREALVHARKEIEKKMKVSPYEASRLMLELPELTIVWLARQK